MWRDYYLNHRQECVDRACKYQVGYRNTPMGRASRLVGNYNQFDKQANRGQGDLTAEWVAENILSKPCAHCGKEGWQVIGCNRLDNSKPHTKDNVEPCCMKCNQKLYYEEQKKRIGQYTLDGELVKVWNSTKECVEDTGYNRQSICACCNNKYRRDGNNIYKGYIFKKIDVSN